MNEKYNLTLADGNNWLLEAEPELADWFGDFSKILSLTKNDLAADNSISFFSTENLNEDLKQQLLSGGDWEFYFDACPIDLWINKNRNKSIIGIDKSSFNVRELYYMYMMASLSPLFFWSLKGGGIPIHAALVTFNGKGVLISATGDTGKTTCCNRLPKKEWHPLCDDLALLVKDKNGELFAHPLPTWSDYMIRNEANYWQVQRPVPIKAVFFLEQSNSDNVEPLAALETFVRLLSAVKQSWVLDMEEEQLAKRNRNNIIFNNTQAIAKEIPGYSLQATLNGSFWKHIEEVL